MNNTLSKQEILINSSHINYNNNGEDYEFILNKNLTVIECLRINYTHCIDKVNNLHINLDGMLFELNHVRVNPHIDNTNIIEYLTNALNSIGVKIISPNHDEMATCYKPLGEITDNVRFYITQNSKIIFLSPSQRPKLINCKY